MKNCILFDNDGVLVHTEPLYYEANKIILKKELNLDLEFEYYMNIMSKGGSAFELAFSNGVSKSVVEACRTKRDSLYQELITTKDIAIKDVKTVLKELAKKYKMAIVTTSRRVDFELIHKNRGIVDFMDFVLCEEDYERAKPYPDPYLKALEIFGARAEDAVVVEDSNRGLKAAKSANIDCIVVENEFTLTQDFSQADFYIKRFDELLKIL